MESNKLPRLKALMTWELLKLCHKSIQVYAQWCRWNPIDGQSRCYWGCSNQSKLQHSSCQRWCIHRRHSWRVNDIGISSTEPKLRFKFLTLSFDDLINRAMLLFHQLLQYYWITFFSSTMASYSCLCRSLQFYFIVQLFGLLCSSLALEVHIDLCSIVSTNE